MAADPFAVEQDFTAARMVNAVDAVEHRGFAGPVRTDQRYQFGWRGLEEPTAKPRISAEAETTSLTRSLAPVFFIPTISACACIGGRCGNRRPRVAEIEFFHILMFSSFSASPLNTTRPLSMT